MNCEQAEELLGAWAIDALRDDEAAEFRAHIATCADHATRAREMRAFAAALAETVEPVAPPPELRARVLEAVAREPQETADSKQQTAANGVGHPPSGVEDRASLTDTRGRVSYMRGRKRWPLPAQAWGALAAAVIAGLLAWNIVLQTGGESDAERYAVANADAVAPLLAVDDAPVGSLLIFEDERKVAVVVDGVRALGASQTYQMWAIAGGAPSSVGLMTPDARGRSTQIVAFDAARAETFAVTIEPAGGSAQPTSDPVFVATIPR